MGEEGIPPTPVRYVFYPRMSTLVRSILTRCYSPGFSRDMCQGSEKRIAMQLMWDGWIEVVGANELALTKGHDLKLTTAGLEWLAKDFARKQAK